MVMALPFGDTRCAIRTLRIGWSHHQHFRLIRNNIWRSQHGRCCTESISTSTLPVPSAVPINRKCWCCDWPIGDILVPHRVPPKGIVITAGSRLPTYTFSEIKFFSSRWFLDIEKSVLRELKGVKIIKSYRDLFQLIGYFSQLIYSSFFDWELMWFCIVVQRHLPASVKCVRSSVAIGALVTLCLLCHSSF